MIVVDASALISYLSGTDPAVESEMLHHAGEVWLVSPLALAEVLAPAASDPQTLARLQHVLSDIGLIEVDLTSHAARPLAQLMAEGDDAKEPLTLPAAATIQLALGRDATVLSNDSVMRSACRCRGVPVIPTGRTDRSGMR